MKLTRLRLHRLQVLRRAHRFPDRAGLTGVVGPNGCGKSNLVEALRWVMGETSYKSMRAADMDDVIFSGNNSRPRAQPRRSRDPHRQYRPRGAGAVQRRRDRLTSLAASSAIRARPIASTAARSAPATCRCCSPTLLNRRRARRPRPSGPHRRNHPGKARTTPPRAGRSRRHFRPACAPP